MKQYDYRTEEYISMEAEYNKIMDWIFRVQDEILTANDKSVLIKIVGMMKDKEEKVLEDVSMNDIRRGMSLSYDEVEEAVWRLVRYGFFREIYDEKGILTEKLYLVHCNLHPVEIANEAVA